MRLLIDTLISVMLAGVLAAVLIHYRQQDLEVDRLQSVHQTLIRLQEQVCYHGAIGEAHTGQNGFPREISPVWFADGVPFNPLVPGWHPWIDIAAEDDQSDIPPDPVIRRPDQAGFWYNPNRGVFRARILPQFTEAATLELFNDVNGTSLTALNESIVPPPESYQTAEVATRAGEADGLLGERPTTPRKVPTLRDQDP